MPSVSKRFLMLRKLRLLLADVTVCSRRALNYGATGTTIGHELSHNYDNTGRQYNELGNVAEWWTTKSVEEYATRAECLVRYYDGIEVTRYNKTVRNNLTYKYIL